MKTFILKHFLKTSIQLECYENVMCYNVPGFKHTSSLARIALHKLMYMQDKTNLYIKDKAPVHLNAP